MKQVGVERPTVRILFLGANPSDTTKLALDREVRQITERLRATPHASRFEFTQEWAVRVGDLQGALLRHRPTIIHFSGHGLRVEQARAAGEAERDVVLPGAKVTGGAILLENEHGGSIAVGAEALENLLRIVGDVRCVVLNACFSAEQSEALRRQADCVVGMADSIPDKAAITFAWAFYQALGYGESVGKAFKLGCNQIELEGLRGKDLPCLVVRAGVVPADMQLFAAPEAVQPRSPRVEPSPGNLSGIRH